VVRAFAGLLLALLVTLAILLLGRPAQAGTEARPVAVRTVLVQPGETLWDIAARVAPEVDRRDTVLRIVELNALPSSSVQAGQELAVPPA
jgi:predicted Zn-dependent protease